MLRCWAVCCMFVCLVLLLLMFLCVPVTVAYLIREPVIECLVFGVPDPSTVLYCMFREPILHQMHYVVGARPFKTVVLYA